MKLFISYRSLDSAKVDALLARLRTLKNPDGTHTYHIWQDKTSIPVGQDWWQAIVQGIVDCDIFVYMISHESVTNVNCRAELSYARKRNRPVIPIVLEGEYTYNTTTGKNDITFWEDVPEELSDGRFQFLFYEGVSFVQQLNMAVERIRSLNLRDIPAPEPPDPRHANDASNDTTLIYDQACDYAWRLELDTAEKLFQRLIDWNDSLFAEDAHEWIVLLRSYQQLMRIDARRSARYKLKTLWPQYAEQFPKPFTPLFDPKGFQGRFSGNAQQQQQPPPAPAVVRSKPTSLSLLPKPFAWIEIPGKGYSIAKYPITNAQFAKFIEADGYKEQRFWTEAGWQARAEGWYFDTSDYEWKPSGNPWTAPRFWQDSKWNGAEQPVVGVSWYEAIAFCLWLSERTGENIMLPTEDQWQYAAQGDDGREYPWGNDWDCKRCNNSVSPCKSDRTTPVRQYEGKGDSPFGVVDMAGNVWEWCRTEYESGSNEIEGGNNAMRVLRGGAWDDVSSRNFRCADRFGYNPFLRLNGWGFRASRS